MAVGPTRFVVLVYRLPARPTANRVYVWRMLKKIGAVSLQQSVTVFPQNKQVTRDLQPILKKIDDSSGEYYLLPLRQLPSDEMAKLVAQFVDQTARHYQEIIENCEVDFTKEIEFEVFRANLTYEEAEEIRADYEKIVSWFKRVSDRDWFGAPNRDAAAGWLERCAALLEDFEAKVYRAQAGSGSSTGLGPLEGSSGPTQLGRRRSAPATGATNLRGEERSDRLDGR
jgi:Skp family chaperone for outer membrane proteins